MHGSNKPLVRIYGSGEPPAWVYGTDEPLVWVHGSGGPLGWVHCKLSDRCMSYWMSLLPQFKYHLLVDQIDGSLSC